MQDNHLTRLVLASNNRGKLKEFGELLLPLGFELLPQAELNVPEADEPFATFVENALAKARHAARLTGLPALADDSGICAPALGGAPGVHSARYAAHAGEAKSDAANNQKLIAALAGKDASVSYYCVLVFLRHADDPQPLIADGHWHGRFQPEAQGEGGFGYDPHFYVPELGKTAAGLSSDEKNRLSHRGKALQNLIAALRSRAEGAP
jgi:XTP/dITP diphosphohydrolase